MRHTSKKQMSESFLTAAFLSISGGLQDAYTYIFRGKVFANAQTGNIVLLSQSITERDYAKSIHYMIPLLSFAFGIIIAELIRLKYQKIRHFHSRYCSYALLVFFRLGIMSLQMQWFLFPVQCRCRHSGK